MNVKYTQSRTDIVQNETVDGLNISVLLESSAVNTVVPDTSYGDGLGFDASLVQLDVKLKREGSVIEVLSTNLGIIGQFHTIKKGGRMWRKGLVLQRKGVAKTQIVNRVLFVPFGDHINVNADEELIITLTFNRGSIGAGITDQTAEIQVLANQSVGLGAIVPKFMVHPVQSQNLKETVNLGDNLIKLALLSFETDPEKLIYRTASLSSDKLDFMANELELPLRHFKNFDDEIADRLIVLGENDHPMYYPNTLLIHDGLELDNAKLSVELVGVNVQSSKNFICYQTFVTSQSMMNKHIEKTAKHNSANLDKVPLTIG